MSLCCNEIAVAVNVIETNPGPPLAQCIHGSLHQVTSVLGRSAGLQSFNICLRALAFLS